jgi:hypothetical protein
MRFRSMIMIGSMWAAAVTICSMAGTIGVWAFVPAAVATIAIVCTDADNRSS